MFSSASNNGFNETIEIIKAIILVEFSFIKKLMIKMKSSSYSFYGFSECIKNFIFWRIT